jgi:hypothetical protein
MRRNATRHKRFNKKNKTRRSRMGGAEHNVSEHNKLFVYRSTQVSTQANTDPTYSEIGVIHITESAAVNALRAAATDILNVFGKKGFDNTIYDKARNEALAKLMEHVSPNQKVCNLRMEVENESAAKLFFIHLYGTLLEKNTEIVNPIA